MDYNIIQIDLNGVNCYLIKNENGFILVDTGGHLVMDKQFTNRCEHLQKVLDSAGCTENNLNLILLTHGDNDHVCNSVYLRKHYNTKIAIHNGDRELVENPTFNMYMDSFQYKSFVYKIIFRLLNKTIKKVTQRTLDEFTGFTPDVLLEDGFNLYPYGLDAAVIHIPGHTKGSIAVLTKKGDLIAGDTFTNVKKPGYALNAGDFKQLSESIGKLRSYSIVTVYPGHGDPFDFKEIYT